MASSLNGLDGGILDRLYKVIESRRGADPAVSNTARLFAKGTEKIAQTVYEDSHALAFHDINPQARLHVLVIPKGAYVSWADFAARGSTEEIAGLVRAVGKVAAQLGLDDSGYRTLANHGPDSHQEVPHFH